MPLQNLSELLSPNFLNDSYLSKALGEEFIFCDNGNMVFHWADFYETCDFIKDQVRRDPDLMQDFRQREIALSKLSSIPVWVRTHSKVYQTTMLNLYDKYILDQKHLLGGVDPFCPLEISFISGTGPFKNMSIVECFNITTYNDFFLVYLIQEKLPRREYRVRLKSKVLFEFGTNFNQAQVVSLEQLSTHGILFSIDSDAFMKQISEFENVRILINANMLYDGLGKNLSDLKIHLSHYAFNFLYTSNKEDSMVIQSSDFQIQSSFDFAKNKKILLFISYEKLAKSQAKGVKTIRQFVDYTKELVRDHYLRRSGKLKSA